MIDQPDWIDFDSLPAVPDLDALEAARDAVDDSEAALEDADGENTETVLALDDAQAALDDAPEALQALTTAETYACMARAVLASHERLFRAAVEAKDILAREAEEFTSWIKGLNYGGCASGHYMPAVTYFAAVETMNEHGDAVLEYIEAAMGNLPAVPDGCSWSGLAVHFLSTAVELWGSSVEAQLEEAGL